MTTSASRPRAVLHRMVMPGHVCPFGLKAPLPVYCDVSLKAFDIVVPAAGSTHSAVRIAPMRMAELTAAEWVDVCEVRP